MRFRLTALFSFLAFAVQAQTPAAKPAEVPPSYLELLRTDISLKKSQIMNEALLLNDADSKKFWPVYKEYEAELVKLNDKRLDLIKDYAKNWKNLSDAKALELGNRALEYEAQRVELKKRYFTKMAKTVSPTVAAKAFQVENQLLQALDLQLASELPLIK